MVFPPNEVVENVVHKKRKRNSSSSSSVSKSKGTATSTSVSTTTPFSSSYATSPFLSNFLQCQQPKLELDTFCAHVLHVSCTTRSGTRFNEPIPIQIVHLALIIKMLQFRMSHRKLQLLHFIHQGGRLDWRRSLHQEKMCMPLQMGEQAPRLQVTLPAQLQIPEARSNCYWNEQRWLPHAILLENTLAFVLWTADVMEL